MASKIEGAGRARVNFFAIEPGTRPMEVVCLGMPERGKHGRPFVSINVKEKGAGLDLGLYMRIEDAKAFAAEILSAVREAEGAAPAEPVDPEGGTAP